MILIGGAMSDKFDITTQLNNFVSHMNTYRKKRSIFLASDDVKKIADTYNITEEELRTLLKSK